ASQQGRAIRIAQLGGEVRQAAGGGGAGARTVQDVHRVRREIVDAHPAALVGICHRATVLEPPLARGGDLAVDASRAGRGGGDDARAVRVEARRDLHHHGRVHLPCAVVVEGERILARDLAFAKGVAALDGYVRAVEHAVYV